MVYCNFISFIAQAKLLERIIVKLLVMEKIIYIQPILLFFDIL